MNRYVRAVEGLTLSAERETAIRAALREKTKQEGRTIRLARLRRAPLIAAAVLLLALSVSAALSRISMQVAGLYVDEGDGVCTVSFRQGDDLPVHLGCWYPKSIGNDYALQGVTTDENGYQQLAFQKTWNDAYYLLYFRAEAANCFTMKNVAAEGTCEVSGHPAHWFHLSGSEVYDYHTKSLKSVPASVLFWVDETRGIGFRLVRVGSETEDLTPLAESVEELDEPLPTVNDREARMAVSRLGDYDFASVPEGFALHATYGAWTVPLEADYADQPGFVHRVYLDGEYYSLHLYYVYLMDELLYYDHLDVEEPEVYGVPYTTQPVADGDFAGEAVYEQGTGRLLGVNWEHTDSNGVTLDFSVKADRLSLEELLSLARSVECRAESDPASPLDR